jgi:two-component system chemotaxis sensor kinase CheA
METAGAGLIEEIAARVMGVESTDLPGLADLHTRFEELARSAVGPSVSLSAANAAKALESIILRESRDAEASLKSVVESVAALQRQVTAVLTRVPPAGHTEAVPDESPISSDDVTLVREFITEASEHIASAEAAVLRLESAEDSSAADPEAVNGIFRGFHTVKGVAGFLNLRQIGALAHAAENLLDRARKGDLELDRAGIDLVLESIDLLRALVQSLKDAVDQGVAPRKDLVLPGLVARLNAFASGAHRPAPVAAPAAPAMVAGPEERASASREDQRAAEIAPAEPIVQARPAAQGPPAHPTAPVATGGAVSKPQAADATVKISTERLDSLINMVGELVIAQSMVAQDMKTIAGGNQRLSRNMGHLSKIARELQELSMSMRMVPILGVFQKMSRLVRDLSSKFGKQLELELAGGDTELDRNVVEAISDPLVHMVRNAADHGIEPPADREKAGKTRTGHIHLRAFHQAGNIVIEITDDGRGINKKRVRQKAIDAGIVRPDQDLSEQETLALIFHAGLSTAEKVTDVSGRGVGMDVVKKNVEALRGRIDIASAEGSGSTFTIRLPLTLAVIDGLIIRVGRQRYVVPILSVERSLRPKPAQLSTVQGRGEMCMVRDTLLPLYRLHRMFDVPGATQDPTEALVVVVQDDRRRCCLLVDELLGQQQVVIKSLGQGVGQVRGVSGGAILGDGNVSLILDVPGLVSLSGDDLAHTGASELQKAA